MEANNPLDFSDLDELPGPQHLKGAEALPTNDLIAAPISYQERTLKSTTRQRVKHACGRCNGTGSYRGYGFTGQCYRCHGAGFILRAASYEANKAKRERAKLREAAEYAEREIARRQANIDQFKARHPDLSTWLIVNANDDFAQSLRESVANYGNLSVAQEACVRRQLGTYQAPTTTSPLQSDLDVSSLRGYYAVPDGETRLKLCVRHPGAQSKYHGWIFVDDGAAYGQRQNYGKQAPGGKYRGKVQEQLRAILADPLAAQMAYGRLTGVCGHCGRTLEDAESVAAGIGPICAGKLAAGMG